MEMNMNELKYFKKLVLEKAEQYQQLILEKVEKNESVEMYGETIEETIAYEIRDEEYDEVNELINEKIDEIIDQKINEMKRKSIILMGTKGIIDDEGNRKWMKNKILDNLKFVQELKDVFAEIKYLSKPENIKKLLKNTSSQSKFLNRLKELKKEINMNEEEKREVLEQIWNDWSGSIHDEFDLAELESQMNDSLKPNKRELNKLGNDIFINSFICEKIKEFNESHERMTFPNTYYGD